MPERYNEAAIFRMVQDKGYAYVAGVLPGSQRIGVRKVVGFGIFKTKSTVRRESRETIGFIYEVEEHPQTGRIGNPGKCQHMQMSHWVDFATTDGKELKAWRQKQGRSLYGHMQREVMSLVHYVDQGKIFNVGKQDIVNAVNRAFSIPKRQVVKMCQDIREKGEGYFGNEELLPSWRAIEFARKTLRLKVNWF